MDYRQLNAVLRRAAPAVEAPSLAAVERDVAAVFDAIGTLALCGPYGIRLTSH
jgi:hypothetical protein